MNQYSALFTVNGSMQVHSIRHFCDSEDEMRAYVWGRFPNTDYIITIDVVPYKYS